MFRGSVASDHAFPPTQKPVCPTRGQPAGGPGGRIPEQRRVLSDTRFHADADACACAGDRTEGEEPARRRRDVDLVREPLLARQARQDRDEGAFARDRDRADQVGRRHALLEPVLLVVGQPAARTRAERLRLAVHLRAQARQGGARRRRGRGAGRRLPGDGRRGAVRGPLPAGLDLHDHSPLDGRPGLPGRTRQLPLRRLPPGAALLGLPRPGRRPVQRAAALLEGHRHHRRHRVHPHLGVEPHLQAADRPARAGLQQPEGGPDQALPGAGDGARLRRRQLVELAVGSQASSGRRWASRCRPRR